MPEATGSESSTGQEDLKGGLPPAEKPKESPPEDKFEAAAKEQGWKPESEYKGPEGGFVGAEEFVKRAPLFEHMSSQKKEIKKLQRSIEAMTSQFSTQVKAQVALRVNELKAAKTEAIKAGDVAQVEQIETAIAQEEQVTAATPDTAVADAWIAENAWFEKDPAMKAVAMDHSQRYVKNNPNAPVAETLAETRKAVEKAFPQHFKPTPKAEPPPSPVETGGSGKDTSGKKNYVASRLSSEQKTVYDQMVTRTKTLKHDEFFAGLDAIGELA